MTKPTVDLSLALVVLSNIKLWVSNAIWPPLLRTNQSYFIFLPDNSEPFTVVVSWKYTQYLRNIYLCTLIVIDCCVTWACMIYHQGFFNSCIFDQALLFLGQRCCYIECNTPPSFSETYQALTRALADLYCLNCFAISWFVQAIVHTQNLNVQSGMALMMALQYIH